MKAPFVPLPAPHDRCANVSIGTCATTATACARRLRGAAPGATDRRRSDRPALRPGRDRLHQPRPRAGGAGRGCARALPRPPPHRRRPRGRRLGAAPRPPQLRRHAARPRAAETGKAAPAPPRRPQAARPPAAPSLMLVSHLDVVGAAPELFTPQIRDGRLYGRGSNDMKAGLAAAVIVAERLAAEARAAGGRSPLRGDLLVAGCADEEWESFGAEALVTRYHPDAAILPECTDLDVTVEHGGFTWFELESRGVEAAGAEPEKGVDAIALLGPVLAGIAALDRELDARPHASYGRGSIHASTIAGGTQLPAYPGALPARRRALPDRRRVGRPVAGRDRGAARGRARRRPALRRQQPPGRGPRARRAARDDPVVLALVAAAAAELGRAPARARRHRLGRLGHLRRGRHPLRPVRPDRRRRAHRRRVGRRRLGQARGARARGAPPGATVA